MLPQAKDSVCVYCDQLLEGDDFDNRADNLIVATFRRLLAEAGPRQAEVMRACAVPRWFDLAVLAAAARPRRWQRARAGAAARL